MCVCECMAHELHAYHCNGNGFVIGIKKMMIINNYTRTFLRAIENNAGNEPSRVFEHWMGLVISCRVLGMLHYYVEDNGTNNRHLLPSFVCENPYVHSADAEQFHLCRCRSISRIYKLIINSHRIRRSSWERLLRVCENHKLYMCSKLTSVGNSRLHIVFEEIYLQSTLYMFTVCGGYMVSNDKWFCSWFIIFGGSIF